MDVITYGNGMFLQEVFNAIASVFGNGSYEAALATCMTMASIGVLISMALQGRLSNYLWFVQVIFFYMMLIVPKVTVNIVDKNDLDPTVVGGWSVRQVQHVPIGVALTASTVSTFSSWLTTTFETVFSLPNDMRYGKNGPLFMQRLAQDATSYKVRDASLLQSVQNFWKSCVFYDMALGFYSFDTLAKQSNIMEFLKENTAQTRGFYMLEGSGAQTFQECRAGVTELERRIGVDLAFAQLNMTKNAHVTLPDSNAVATSGWSSMPVGFAYLTNISTTASDLLIQSAMINSMDDGLSAMAGQADVQGAIQGYAIARAERERESTFGAIGRLAADMLPILKNLTEGLIIAVFPLVGLAVMFPNGWKVMLHYGRMLLWVSLWPVCFALLNFCITYFGAFAVQKEACFYEVGTSCSATYSIYTQLGIMEVLKKYQAIAGYLMTMIPMLTYMFVSQASSMMAGLVGRVMDGYAQPAQHAAMEASAGNFSVGNLSFQNQSAFQHNSAPSQSVGFMTTNDGMYTDTNSKYGETHQQNVSRLAMSPRLNEAHERSLSHTVENATSHVSSTSASLAKSRDDAIRDAFTEVQAGAESRSTSKSSQENYQHALSEMTETIRGNAENYAKGQKWSEEDRKAFVDEVMVNTKAGVDVGFAGASAQTKMGLSRNRTQASSTTADRVQQFMSSDQAKEALSKLHSITTATQEAHGYSSTHSQDSQHNQSYERAVRSEAQHTEALQHLEAAKALQAEAQRSGFSIDIDKTPGLINEFKKEGIEWKKGVNDLGNDRDTSEARDVQQAMDRYFEQRAELGDDHNINQQEIQQSGGEAVKRLELAHVPKAHEREIPLRSQAETEALLTRVDHKGQGRKLDEALKQREQNVRQKNIVGADETAIAAQDDPHFFIDRTKE